MLACYMAGYGGWHNMFKKIKKLNNGFYQFEKDGLMYGVGPHELNNDDDNALYEEIQAYALAHPDEVNIEQPYVPTLEEVKANKLAAINSTYEQLAKQAQIDTPDSEVLTWDIQKAEAEAWEKDNSTPTPFIDGLALGRGVDRVELILKVLEKVKAYSTFMSMLTGIRQGCEDKIKTANTIDDVTSVVFKLPDIAV